MGNLILEDPPLGPMLDFRHIYTSKIAILKIENPNNP